MVWHPAVMLDFIPEALEEITFAMQRKVAGACFFSVFPWRVFLRQLWCRPMPWSKNRYYTLYYILCFFGRQPFPANGCSPRSRPKDPKGP